MTAVTIIRFIATETILAKTLELGISSVINITAQIFVIFCNWTKEKRKAFSGKDWISNNNYPFVDLI